MKILERFRNGVNRMAEKLEVFKKDVFELEGVPAFREYYTLFIFVWQAIYKGFYKDWHQVPVVTLKNPKGKTRTMATMNAGKMACTQMARYVWNERCALTVSMKGREADSDTPDPLNEFLQHVLAENRFGTSFGDLLEKSFALGGAALKEYVEIPKNRDGSDADEGKIRISYHMAPQFVPTSWDNSRVTSAIFISREAKNGYYYSVVEWHRWDGNTYRVSNDLYRMKIKETAEPQTILGWWYPLNMVYPLLSPETEFTSDRTFFQYIRPFGANYADDNSPLGMSIYAPALNTLHGLDIEFDSLQREFVLGKKRIIAPARAMKNTVLFGGQTPQTYFDADDEVWQALSSDDVEGLKIHDNSVELRVSPHLEAINGSLSILCAQIGFDAGVLNFDAARGMQTATQVVSENSKTFSTVQAHENNVRDELTAMVHSILGLAEKYELTWKGQPVSALMTGGYDVSVKFDDSIIQDRQTDINEGVMLVGANLMSKKRFMTHTLGMTPEEAENEINQIKAESPTNAVDVTRLFGGVE